MKDVIEAAGLATVSGNVEVTIDQGVLSTAEGRQQALLLLNQIENYIMGNPNNQKWPPA